MRVVVGRWAESPFGGFTDVMLAEADGTRRLLAPSEEIAAYVRATYCFDDVVLGPVAAEVSGTGPWTWQVTAPGLDLWFEVGERSPLGTVLRLVPVPLAARPAFTLATDPVARAVLRGVRTRGTAGGGRREFYGATDLHPITAASGTWRGRELGPLRPVSPEPGFGFGSTPTRPSVTSLVTTILLG